MNSQQLRALGYHVEYILTVAIAKEICMVVGAAPRTNPQTRMLSKMYRTYFIECEKIATQRDKEAIEELQHRLIQIGVKGRTLNDVAACTGHPRKDIEKYCYKEKWYSKINGDVLIHKENLVTRKRKNAIEFTEEGFDLITKKFKKSKQKSII